jgi:hypothetical protein
MVVVLIGRLHSRGSWLSVNVYGALLNLPIVFDNHPLAVVVPVHDETDEGLEPCVVTCFNFIKGSLEVIDNCLNGLVESIFDLVYLRAGLEGQRTHVMHLRDVVKVVRLGHICEVGGENFITIFHCRYSTLC